MKLLPHWLNWLIEAESLISVELNAENLDNFAAQVINWQQSVQSQLPSQLSADSERKAAMQLQVYSEQLVTKLTTFRSVLQSEQQQLIKQNIARTAYNNAR